MKPYQFQKGNPKPPNSGRKKGTPNKKKLKKVAEVLAESGIEPASEIIKEIALMDEPKDRAKAWCDLLAYCEAKPKAGELEDEAFDPEDFKEIETADLLSLVKKEAK